MYHVITFYQLSSSNYVDSGALQVHAILLFHKKRQDITHLISSTIIHGSLSEAISPLLSTSEKFK